MNLNDQITGIMATYDRPEACRQLLASWPPDMPLVVVDQSDHYYVYNADLDYPRPSLCVVIPSPEIGISAAYRLALSEVATPFFAFVEDDFRIRSDTDYGILLDTLQRGGYDLLGGELRKVKQDGSSAIQAQRCTLRIHEKTLHIDDAHPYGAVCLADHVSNHYVARTDVVREVDPWDPGQRAFEHLEFSLAMKDAGTRVAACMACPVDHVKVSDTLAYAAIRREPLRRYQVRFMQRRGLERIHHVQGGPDVILTDLIRRETHRGS